MVLRPLGLLIAVSVAAVCPGQEADLRSRINDALDSARPALLAHLHDATKSGTRPGVLALVLLAALHDGVPTDDGVMQRAMQRLAKADPDQTYDLALRLMVLEACPSFPGRDALAKADTKDLLRHRNKDGCFQYNSDPGGWDLSNTQYGALGLRSAVALGEKVPRDAWRDLVNEIAGHQTSYGGFSYAKGSRGRDDVNPSMTAAGIAVLAICRQQLGDGGTTVRKLDGQIERGWQWFAQNPASIGSSKVHWSFYFHYGLERAAILCDVERVGGQVDWYVTGARMLVDEQLPGGGWQSTTDGFPGGHLDRGRGDLVPTSFAVLFLRRKFQKELGPITPHVVTLAAVGPHSKDADVDACADWLKQRGKEAMGDIVKGLRSEIAPQRRAACKALRAIAGQDFGFDPARDHEANRDAVRAAELWYLRNR